MDDVYLLKFGGNAIRGHDDLMRLSGEIAQLIRDGAKIVLVHGGGPEISAEMEKRGMTPRKVAGLRITDAEGLEVATEVLRGLNGDVVGCLEECGVKALGMPGYFVTECVRKPPVKAVEDGTEILVDLGLVGEVSGVDVQTVEDLLAEGITPVVYPIGAMADGSHLNVNADTMASGLAAGIKCKEMITITDVPGILLDINDPASKVDCISLPEVDRLIADGTISGGMIPKVEACRAALLSGVAAVRMVNGKDPRSIVSDVMQNKPHGTVIVK
jgi:acetylglutamate kinase